MRIGHLTISAVLAATLLAGCSDSNDSGTSGALSPEDRVAAFAAMSDRLGDRFNTGWTGQPGEMPSDGTATFTGYAGIAVDAPGGVLGLLGIAELEADFAALSITGSADDFYGDQDGTLDPYEGSLAFINGAIGSGVPNDIDFDYVGVLTGEGNTIILDGSVFGKFKGTPIVGLVAASDLDTVLLNGTSEDALVAIVAEID